MKPVLFSNSLLAADQLTNEQARKTLDQILNTPEFYQARRLGYFEDLIRQLMENFGFVGNIDGIGTLLEVIIVLAGFILIIYLARMAIPFWKIMTPDVQGEKPSETAHIRPVPADLMIEADKMASQGHYRHALRYMYLSLLMEMDNRRLITYGSAKTDSEYLRGISQKAAGLKGLFRSMVDLFECKWYGLEDCGREDFQKGRELYAALLKEASHV
ncbi:MAG: hypothetical protein K6T65_02445 [Peptococcaceae bacterium]|nr:hypothetical protein [Peptococcaceae bacterium]